MTEHDASVRIDPYDPAWPCRFEEEATRLRAALGTVTVAIDHVGSTSVPGLGAKPIVDIQITVPSLEPADAYRRPLEAAGYRFVPDDEMPDLLFFANPPQPPRRFHVHVMEAGSHQEHRHLAVRDYLRRHPDETRAYEAHKRAVAAQAAGDIEVYVAAKDAFVKDLERRALAEQPLPEVAP